MEKSTNTTARFDGCYGEHAKPAEVQNWVFRNVLQNIDRCNGGQPRTTLSVWGAPGCSKTSIIKQLEEREIEFNGQPAHIKVVDIPLAQIEEMGDVLGFPVEELEITGTDGKKWVKAVDAVIAQYIAKSYEITGNKRTTYAPPSWVPTEECPGVILFDDGNRASQRIMKGLMQLVQDYRTIAWSIPKGWTIVFTGNPDNKFNQVSSMDTAQLTRMKHITLEADAKQWAIWAENHGIDKRGINFILRYPEMMIGKERTNPRTLTEFFYSLKSYTDLTDKQQLHDCMLDAHASLDEETVATMTTFLLRDAELVISPEMILEDSGAAEDAIGKLMHKSEPRIDIIAVTLDRLFAHLMTDSYQPGDKHADNFKKLVLSKDIPQDLIFAFCANLADAHWKYARRFIVGPEMVKMFKDLHKHC